MSIRGNDRNGHHKGGSVHGDIASKVILHEDQSIEDSVSLPSKTKRSSKQPSLASGQTKVDYASLDDDALEKLEKQQMEKDKQEMFKFLLSMDSNSQDEISIKNLISLPYRVDGEDSDVLMTTQNIVKLIKM